MSTEDWRKYVVTAGDLRAQLSVLPDDRDTPVVLLGPVN